MKWLIIGLLLWTTSVGAQQIGQNSSPQSKQAPKITVSTQLVVETVVVRDKKERPVGGLTAKDFTITEDGVPQQISFCEPQELDETVGSTPLGPVSAGTITVYDRIARTHIAPETPGNVRYRNRRLLALYFDMTTMQPQEQIRALKAAQKFIRTQMTAADLVAILGYTSGAVEVLQDFTDDRPRLLNILETMIVGEGQGFGKLTDDASAFDAGNAFGQDDAEFNVFNTNRELAALQTAAQMLGHLSEKKSLVYFASGLRLNGIDNQAQMRATIDTAIRADVSFWPIDTRGLEAQAPLGDATVGSPIDSGAYTGASALAMMTDFQQSQDTLYALASDTGGNALFNYNDLATGIVRAQRSISSYYILAYYTKNSAHDGKFRRVEVSLNGGLSASLDYRRGYYASKEFRKFNGADKERQLEEALMLEDPITDLTIAMEIDYFQLNRAEYFVPIVVKIPGRELALAKRRGAQHTIIDFIGEIKDEYGGITISNVRDKVDIKLSDSTAADLAKRPVEYDTGFTLLPGKYTIKFLARDDETGRIGTFQTSFVIPNLNKEQERIPISSVVLASQRVKLSDALFNVKKGKVQAQEEAANPLVANGEKLIPSVTRVFSKSHEMYVLFQAYEPRVRAAQPLVAFVGFYWSDAKAYETRPVQVTVASQNQLKTVVFDVNVSLGKLRPGEYNFQVTVLDPEEGRVAFWQTPIMVVP